MYKIKETLFYGVIIDKILKDTRQFFTKCLLPVYTFTKLFVTLICFNVSKGITSRRSLEGTR